jgi:hypothetical protein
LNECAVVALISMSTRGPGTSIQNSFPQNDYF